MPVNCKRRGFLKLLGASLSYPLARNMFYSVLVSKSLSSANSHADTACGQFTIDSTLHTVDSTLINASNSMPVSDSDCDGILDNTDNCLQHPNVDQANFDGDSLGNACDNCTLVDNEDQRDTDADNYGNLCDGDLNNDGTTNTLDLNLYKLAHRSSLGDTNYNADADFNGDAVINTLDLNTYKSLHRRDPGPSCCELF